MKATSRDGASSQCQTCKRRWPDSYTRCPDDGGELIPISVTDDPTDQVRISSAELENSLAPGTVVGEYCVETEIGQGAMGAVYVARHPTIGKRVAIKIMAQRLSREPEAVERFVGEARAVAAIRHPGIVDVFGFGKLADGRLYLVMELLDGESLRSCLDHRRLSLADALDLLFQIARALEAAHDEGVIHRDLKPENVFLVRVAKEPRPIVKLLDFGLAKLVDTTDRGDRRVRRTQSGQLLGTPLYMSPEQCKAKLVDHRTDIYALGCLAYELFCGRVPFDFDNVAELIAAHLTEVPPRPRVLWPEISPVLDTLLFEMLAKDAAQRPTLEHIERTISTVRTTVSATLVPPATARAASSVAQTTLGSTTTGELHAVRAGASWTRRAIVGIGAALAIATLALAIDRPRHDTDDRGLPTVPPPAKPAPPASSEPPQVEVEDSPKPELAPHGSRPTTGRGGSAKSAAKPPKPVANAAGALALSSTPACDISIDGKPTGLRTPQRKLKLDVGTHSITLISTAFAIRETFSIEIKPGELVTQSKDYSNRTIETAPDRTTTLNPFKKPQVSP